MSQNKKNLEQVNNLEANVDQTSIFRQFTQAASQGFGMATLDGKVVYMNPALYQLLEISATGEVNGNDFTRYYPEDMQARLQKEVMPAVMQEGRWTGELALKSTSGNIVPTTESFFIIPDEAGNPQYLADVVTDNTAQKMAEAQIEAQVKERTDELHVFRALAENAIDAVFIGSLDGTITYANPAAYQLLGYDEAKQELLGMKNADVTAPEGLAMMQETIAALMQAGQWNGEIPQIRKDGTIVDTHLSVFFIKDETGQPTKMAAIIQDISERKTAETERERLAILVENSNDFIGIASLEGEPLFMNEAARKMMGFETIEEEKSTKVIDYFSPEDQEFVTTEVLPTVFEKGRWAGEINFKHLKTGQPIPVIWDVFRIDDPQTGQPLNLATVTRDITKQKQAQAEQERLQQEVIDAQQRAIQELSTPVIPIMDNIIVMPLVGSVDSLRARDVTRSLLAGISRHRAKVVILDVTGVTLMDTGIVNHLNKTIQAARLKGARTIITGITDSVAETVVDLGIDWSELTTLSDLQTGLLTALQSLGVKLTK